VFPNRTLRGYGHYRETYRPIDGQWKAQAVHLARLRAELRIRCSGKQTTGQSGNVKKQSSPTKISRAAMI